VIELRVALARAHVADGQMMAAVAELDEAIAASETTYGPEHRETADLYAERDELQPAAT
jgi:Tfp pilus assembly protein PilF